MRYWYILAGFCVYVFFLCVLCMFVLVLTSFFYSKLPKLVDGYHNLKMLCFSTHNINVRVFLINRNERERERSHSCWFLALWHDLYFLILFVIIVSFLFCFCFDFVWWLHICCMRSVCSVCGACVCVFLCVWCVWCVLCVLWECLHVFVC